MKKLIVIPLLVITVLFTNIYINNGVYAVSINDTSIAKTDLTHVNTFQNESYFRLSVDYFEIDLITVNTIYDFQDVFNTTLVPEFNGGYIIWSIDNTGVDRYVVLSGNGSIVDEFNRVDFILFNRYTDEVEFYLNGYTSPFLTYDEFDYTAVGLNLQAVVVMDDSVYTDTFFRTQTTFYSPISAGVERSILQFEYPYSVFTTNIVDLPTNLGLNERLIYSFYFDDAIDNDYYLNLNNTFIRMFDITYVMIVNNTLRLYQSDKNLRYTVNLTNYHTVSLHYNYVVQDYSFFDAGYDYGYDVGYDVGYDEGYDEGLYEGIGLGNQESYDKGYLDGSNDSFLASVKDWIVPAIIVVLFLGGAVTIVLRKREG